MFDLGLAAVLLAVVSVWWFSVGNRHHRDFPPSPRWSLPVLGDSLAVGENVIEVGMEVFFWLLLLFKSMMILWSDISLGCVVKSFIAIEQLGYCFSASVILSSFSILAHAL